MNESDTSARIRQTVDKWLCTSYSIDIRFIARWHNDGHYQILSSSILLSPLPLNDSNDFEQRVGALFMGQRTISNMSKMDSMKAIRELFTGKIHVYGKDLLLGKKETFDFYSESLRRDIWFYALHLRISGETLPSSTLVEAFGLDNDLRNADIPFDGMSDLAGWLHLSDPTYGQDRPSIVFRMNPPAELLLSACRLSESNVELVVHMHPRISSRRLTVTARSVPGKGLTERRQIASHFQWSPAKDGIRVGKARVALEFADQVLVTIAVDGVTIRRHWFVDPARARNQRLVAVQQFDSDLRMIKRELLTPSTSDKFELAVAALLFLIGFNPVVQIETDSPDLIVMTPEGRHAIVECTTRTADSGLKIGKLVDRRSSLAKSLEFNGHSTKVLGVLICALPKDQMAVNDAELVRNKIVLLCKEDITSALERLRFPRDPDQLLLDAESRFANSP